jgi:hypothetical protein
VQESKIHTTPLPGALPAALAGGVLELVHCRWSEVVDDLSASSPKGEKVAQQRVCEPASAAVVAAPAVLRSL